MPVGIRVSVSASEAPTKVQMMSTGRETCASSSATEARAKRTTDVSDLLIQIKDHGSGGLERRGRAMPRVVAVTKITALMRDEKTGSYRPAVIPARAPRL